MIVLDVSIVNVDLPAIQDDLGSSQAGLIWVISTLAASRTDGLAADGASNTASLLGGYQLGFVVAAATVALGVVLAYALLRPRQAPPALRLAPTVPVTPALDREAA